MPRLSSTGRERAIDMLHAGRSVQNVARTFNVHTLQISRPQTRLAATGSSADIPMHGTPRGTIRADDNRI